MKYAHQAEGRLAEFGRAVGDKGSHPVPHLHHTHRRQVPYPGTEARATDIQGARKLALRGDLVARLQSATLYKGADVVHHLHGPMRVRQVLLHPRHIGPAPS